jgi:hypothetical protein
VNETSTLKKRTIRIIRDSWKAAWHSALFRYQCLAILLAAIIMLSVTPAFFAFIDARQGTPLHDWVLLQLPAQDVSWYTFFVLYTAVLIAFTDLIRYPKDLVMCLQAYCLVTFLRFSAIYFFPLEPPGDIIPLNDPFIAYAFYNGKPVFKDLFFSGHTTTVFLMFLAVRQSFLKQLMLGATFLMGFLVLKQHVHYTVDVLAAPIFTWFSYYLVHKVSPLSKCPD